MISGRLINHVDQISQIVDKISGVVFITHRSDVSNRDMVPGVKACGEFTTSMDQTIALIAHIEQMSLIVDKISIVILYDIN